MDAMKEVDFYTYCPKCKYHETTEKDRDWQFCNECLGQPMAVDSRKPVNYIKKDD